MQKERFRKGDVGITFAVIIGLIVLIISIVIGIRAWQNVSYTECWKDASDQFDDLCLGGGIFECTPPGISEEKEHTIKLGSCVNSVYIVDQKHLADAVINAGYGDSTECELSLKSFIVMVPSELGVAESVGEAVSNPAEYARQRASGLICKGYNTNLQDTNMKIIGPKTDGFIEYCLTVRRIPNSDEEYVFRIEARGSAC